MFPFGTNFFFHFVKEVGENCVPEKEPQTRLSDDLKEFDVVQSEEVALTSNLAILAAGESYSSILLSLPQVNPFL